MKIPNNTITAAVNYFKDELKTFFDVSELEQITQITFFHFFKINRIDLILKGGEHLSESELLKIIYTVKALKKNKPLAYILGQWEFYGLPFKVNEHTLIPRPETEELVDLILKENSGKLNVLDIGTGSGCIPISLKKNNAAFNVFACDISTEALEVAKLNAINNQVEVDFLCYDILANKTEKFNHQLDIIVSNPPYITVKEKELMSNNVLDYEPHLALFIDDNEPLLFYDAISDFAKINLKIGGKLYFEINVQYGNEVKLLLREKGFKSVTILQDMNNKDRIVTAISS